MAQSRTQECKEAGCCASGRSSDKVLLLSSATKSRGVLFQGGRGGSDGQYRVMARLVSPSRVISYAWKHYYVKKGYIAGGFFLLLFC